MFNLVIYFLTLGITKTRVFLKLGVNLKGVVIRAIDNIKKYMYHIFYHLTVSMGMLTQNFCVFEFVCQ